MIFLCFRNVLADSRDAVVLAIFVLLHAIHVLIDSRAKHHDEGLLVLPPISVAWIRYRDDVGFLRYLYWPCGSTQKEV